MTDKPEQNVSQMTEWYNPLQLIDTAKKTAISTIIGENADPRLISAATDNAFFDYSNKLVNDKFDFKPAAEERGEIWIDYVSDVGDGWNSTYSVAHCLARQSIDVSGKSLKRGEIMIFGGDGVYPTANDDEYEKRLIKPYRTAFETVGKTNDGATELEKQPHVYALPGNHDWYDSLVSFQKLFFTHIFNKRLFAENWRTRQKRSYFALKLPHKWWLLGIDLQLQHSIDVPQLKYLERVVEEMEKGDKIIVCVPEPYWVKAIKYEGLTDKFEKKEKSIETFEKILEQHGVEVRLYLAGDLHHYRRFATEDGQYQKITAGGGGAFLHPTHDFDFTGKVVKSKTTTVRKFFWRKNYPEFEDSKALDKGNILFIKNNKSFGILTGILYAFLAFLTHGEISGAFTLRKAFEATVSRCIEQPLALVVVILMCLGLVFFTDSNSKYYKRIAGTIHALFHLTAVFFLSWFGWLASIVIICGVGGYFIGSIIMGLYLYISLHFFKRHDNEAFSALKVEDYKNFVRLHIDTSGALTIYPFKIDQVPKEGDWIFDDAAKTCQPKNAIDPDLIEDPIKII